MKLILALYLTWFKMGLFTFGGGYAMLPMIEREVIEKKHWADEEEIMEYYAIGQCTPGIIAVNTATFVGYRQKGVFGAIAATLGVISPSFLIIGVLASFIKEFREIAWFKQALTAINAAVSYLLFCSLRKLWRNNIKNIASFLIFLVSLLLAIFSDLSTAYLVVIAALMGIIQARKVTE